MGLVAAAGVGGRLGLALPVLGMGLAWDWGDWGWGWGYPGYWGGGYYGVPNGYVTMAQGSWGVVNTDVSPEMTRVFLDGRYIGTADDFDGYPDYLYLRPGKYKVSLQLEGFETRDVDIDSRAGMKIDIKEKLKKIPGQKQYGSYDTPVPEGGLQRFFGKDRNGQDIPMSPDNGGNGGMDVAPHGYSDWRGQGGQPGYGGSQPPQGQEGQQAPPPRVEYEGAPVPPPAASRGRILFKLEPPDAAVYVDDRFAGTAEELSTLSRGLQIAPGPHRIVVSRPGFGTESTQVEVTAGQTENVEISLSKP